MNKIYNKFYKWFDIFKWTSLQWIVRYSQRPKGIGLFYCKKTLVPKVTQLSSYYILKYKIKRLKPIFLARANKTCNNPMILKIFVENCL